MFYLGKLYTGQIKKGESYEKLKKCIHVSILDFIHFPDDKRCYHKISFCDTRTGTPYTDLMELHILELKKLPEKVKSEEGVIRWMQFFSGKTMEDFKKVAKTDEYIDEAYSELLKLSADDRKRLEYEAREKAVRDYNTLMGSTLREGLEQGIRQGVQQGVELKIKEHTLKMLAHGMSPAEIADLLGENPETIDAIAAEFQKGTP